MGIELLDHGITGEENYCSLKKKDFEEVKRVKGEMVPHPDSREEINLFLTAITFHE